MGRFFQTNKDGSVRFTPELAAEHHDLVRRVRGLETQLNQDNVHFSAFGYDYDRITILGRLERLEEKFAAVLDMCKVEVERVAEKPAHYRARRKRVKKS